MRTDSKTHSWENVIPWLQLHLTEGLGALRIARLVEHFGTANAVIKTSRSTLASLLTPSIASNIVSADRNRKIQEQITKIQHWHHMSKQHFILCPDSPEYPALLKQIPDLPPVLFCSGSLDLLQRPQIAIVGSRRPTLQGRKLAEKIAMDLAHHQLVITSGLAMGIDTSAHRGAMSATESSIAVIGTGIDRVYPAENRQLAKHMASKGLILSEFPLGTPPLASNFPKRNRIISGMSLGTLVVEATEKSGSLITARMALEQGRDVFAMPGSVSSFQSKGCHHLIREGAILVEEASQIIEELDSLLQSLKHLSCNNHLAKTRSEKPKTISNEPLPECPVQKSILQSLGSDTWNMDELVMHLNVPMEILARTLTLMELQGAITMTSTGYCKA